MKRCFDEGCSLLASILEELSGWRRTEAAYMLNLGRFISHCCTTTINAKRWYLAKTELFAAHNEDSVRRCIEELTAIGTEEIQNARDTIPLVEMDSRIGWEPSMEYMTDREHLEWKIKVTQITLKSLSMYTDSLRFNY